ncbi:hypothetical protein [Delftia acidovorans]|uniref:hypothetical protein n=1 Tax=Delftia acidovorans TaxID=80866 RepID=UPI00192A7CFF|nr:hypothetical protein [Delftia acidovorans]
MIYTFDSTQAGAPVLSGTAGALATVLKACLVDGFGASAVASLVVTGGIAKANFAASHPYRAGTVGRIAGATPSSLNGDKVIVATTSSSVSFAAPGVPDGAATGTITSRIAPAGWQELFSGTVTNVLVVKPTVIEATGCVLRIDDGGTTNARVRGYESMSDAVTGIGPIPLDSQAAGGLWWSKSNAANGAARPWWLWADERGFYLAVSPQGADDRYTLFYAGDCASTKSGDAWGFLLTGNLSDQTGVTWLPDGCCGWSSRNARGGMYLARSHTGVGQAVLASRYGSHHNGVAAEAYAGTSGYSWGAYPNGPNNGLMTGALEAYALGIRGTLPGLLHPVQEMGGAFATGAVVMGTDDYAGRALVALRVGTPSTGGPVGGTVFVDAAGPWSR